MTCPFSHLDTSVSEEPLMPCSFLGGPLLDWHTGKYPAPGFRGWVVPEVREEEGSERVGDGVGHSRKRKLLAVD